MSTRAATRTSKPRSASRDWRRRLLRHHAPLALTSAVVLALLMALPAFRSSGPHADIVSGTFPQYGAMGAMKISRSASQAGNLIQRSTVATGYLALGLLGLTLLIGPATLLLRRRNRNPVSSYLRRDVGAWTAGASIAHVIAGFNAHSTGQILDYLVRDRRPLLNSFGLGNWTGLAALVIVVALLAISTDGALRELKAKTWKDLQRLNYTLFALVILHAFFYGALLRLTSPLRLLGVLIIGAVVAGQAAGIWLWRRVPSSWPRTAR